MRLAIVAMLLSSTLAYAGGRTPDPVVQKERERLQGTWQLVSAKEHGREINRALAKLFLMKIKGKTLTLEIEIPDAKEKIVQKVTYHVDLKKRHKVLRFGPNGRNIRGIYRLEKDRLIICSREDGRGLPTDFTCKVGSHRSLLIWQRVTK